MTAQQEVYKRAIKKVMNREVVTINAAGTIHEALILMEENRVSTLPVVDNEDHCVGMLSTSDLVDMTRDVDDDVYALEHADPSSQRYLVEKLVHSMGSESIQSFMSETVATVDSSATILTATRKMLREQIHHLPVVDASGKLVGIVSTMDLLGEFADASPEE
jgi:CBS domain-containing protein